MATGRHRSTRRRHYSTRIRDIAAAERRVRVHAVRLPDEALIELAIATRPDVTIVVVDHLPRVAEAG